MVDPPWEPEGVHLDAEHATEARAIVAEIAEIASSGRVLPGSILERRTRCGRQNCACHADPPKLHGPYWQWTRKVANKTVGRWLSEEQRVRLRRLGRQRPAITGAARPPRGPWHREA